MEDEVATVPALTAIELRELLDHLLPTQASLASFCRRYFPELSARWPRSARRAEHLDSLLRDVAGERLLAALLAEADSPREDPDTQMRGVVMGPVLDRLDRFRALLFERDPTERAFARQLSSGWFVIDAPSELCAEVASPISVSTLGSEIRKALLTEGRKNVASQAEPATLAKILRIELRAESDTSCTILPPAQLEQAVLREELTVWEWLVTPVSGVQRLRLQVTLVNVIQVSGVPVHKVLLQRTIELRVQPRAQNTATEVPKVSRAAVRQRLADTLRTDSDLNAFCLDYFKPVFDRFASGMDRIEKVNLLLAWEEPERVLAELIAAQASLELRVPSAPTTHAMVRPVTEPAGPGLVSRPEYTFAVLHLSDLHSRGERETDRWRRDRVLGEQWKRNLDSLLSEGPIDLVCFTGDLADWGQRVEYEAAAEFLGATLLQLALPVERFFVVPGNHDIDRKRSREAEHAWESLRASRAKVDPLALSRWLLGGTVPVGLQESWRDAVLSRQDAYREWLRSFGRQALLPENSSHKRLGYRATVQLPQLPFAVQVLGLDSAWLCGDDADATQLVLTEDQVGRLSSDDQGQSLSGFRLALMHHPLADLADGAACRRLLAERSDLLLRGHLHELEPELWADPDRHLQQLVAGCLYEGHHADHWPNGCALLRITCNSQGRPVRYALQLRSWSTRGHWFDDGSLYRKAPIGRLVLDAQPR